MLCETIALIVCALGVYIYVHFTWNNNFWRDRGVPFEKPLFILGNFKDVLLGRQHFGIFYADLYKKFENSPYVGYFKMNTPVLLIRDPDIIKDVLVNNYAAFSANDFPASTDLVWSANPFSLNGAAWKESRARWISGITPAKIKLSYANMEKRCDIMIQHIKRCNTEESNFIFDGKEITTNLFMDIIISGIFGLQIDSFNETNNPFKKTMSYLFSSSFTDIFFMIAFTVMPWLKLASLSSAASNFEKNVLKLTNDFIASKNDPKMLKNEAYQTIMKNNYDESNHTSSVAKLAGYIFGYIFDGTETSGGLVSFALYELGMNPNIQNKLLEELNTAAAAEDGRISFEELHKLSYLDKIVSETLRMYPPLMSMTRLCTQAPNLSSLPFDIPVNTAITIPTYGLHMDPLHFPDPQVFDPERFTEEAKNSRHKYVYLPFGEGPRICLGSKFALTQAKIALGTLIRNFEVRISPKTGPHPLIIEPSSFILKPINGIWLTFHERKNI